MELGDAVAAHIESSLRIIDDDEVITFLRRIGQRLTAQFPATKFRFQFFIIDSYEVNAFTLPGGRIYVTRKLISFAKTEDELAGVIAHEIGHALARHIANDMSLLWRESLGVTQVGDRKDIFEKYHSFVDTRLAKPKVGEKIGSREDRDQYVADMIGLYLMTGAGYDPQAQANFWDRYQETKGKTGSFFSNLFGTTRPEQKRLAEMFRQLALLPAECKGQSARPSQSEFQKWQSAVVNYTQFRTRESLPGLIQKTRLDPPLRSTVYHLRFSPDGKYMLAQDDSGISVLTREPFAPVFRINASSAYPAQFTPDSRQVILYTPNLRVEIWSIGERSLISANEVVMRISCLQTRLSPDARTIACLDDNAGLLLIDVNEGTPFFEKKSFTRPSLFELLVRVESIFSARGRIPDEGDFVNMAFSPDGRYFLAGDHSYDIGAYGVSDKNNAAGYDLKQKLPLTINSDMKRLVIGGVAFVAPDRIVGNYYDDRKKSGLYSFPEGTPIEQFETPIAHFRSIARGNYLLIDGGGPVAGAVFDLKSKKYFRPGQERLLDVFEETGATETQRGELALYGLKGEAPKILPIPENPLGRLYAANLSPDLKYLALSGSVRGGVWDLTDGKMLVYIRGFRGAGFSDDGMLYMDFPAQDQNPRGIAHFDPVQKTVARDATVKLRNAVQYGDVLIASRPKAEMRNGKEYFDWSKVTMLEAYDAKTYSVLWTQEYVEGLPSYIPDGFFGTVVLAWLGDAKAFAAELKEDPNLTKQLGNAKDAADKYLFKILDLKTGKAIARLVVDTNHRSFKIVDAIAIGDYFVGMDNQNRALVYSISSGRLLGRVFGNRATLSKAANLLCVENESGQLIFYDLTSFEKRGQISFADRIKFVRFSTDGKRVAVLTANQTISTFQIAALDSASPK